MGRPNKSSPVSPPHLPTFPILDRATLTTKHFLEFVFGKHDAAKCLIRLEFLEALIFLILSKFIFVVGSIDIFNFLPLPTHLIILLSLIIPALNFNLQSIFVTCGIIIIMFSSLRKGLRSIDFYQAVPS